MLASLKWLRELSRINISGGDAERKLTAAGLEVEAVHRRGQGLDHVVVAEVRAVRPHPKRDKLSLVTVFDGTAEEPVVCGALNVPSVGGRVVLAKLGAVLPGGLKIEERKLGGEISRGMLCSEVELAIGLDADGIIVLEDTITAAPGTPITEALQLDDTILDLSITPNRPDCLGHIGLARELCAIEGVPFRIELPERPARLTGSTPSVLVQRDQVISLLPLMGTPKTGSAVVPAPPLAPLHLTIRDPQRCPRYGAAMVADVTLAPSPFWLRYRLYLLGLRAINNVVDATNLVLLGFSHPIHAFDFDKLNGSTIEVRLADAHEFITTLDGQSHRLTGDDILICDGNGPVALAGVMGGANSEIGGRTKQVLIECAYFEPRSIRRTSRRLGAHTDSSYRFERGIDPNGVPMVLAYAASLIARLSGGIMFAEAYDSVPVPIAAQKIPLRPVRVGAIIGREVAASESSEILERLGCSIESDREPWQVTVPTHRPDLKAEEDLVEEVARIGGYHQIPTEMPKVRASAEGSPQIISFTRRLREAACAAGLNEAVNYSFVSARELSIARVSTAAVTIANPLSEERSVMRTSLLPGLAANLLRAQRHQVKRYEQFELGRVFVPVSGELPNQAYQLAIMLWGPRQEWYAERENLDFYDGKGAIAAIFHYLCGQVAETVLDTGLDQSAPYLHPRRRAGLTLCQKSIGHLGELHPDVAEQIELQGPVVYAAIDVQAALEAIESAGIKLVKLLPRFPSVTRDLAVVVAEGATAAEIAAAVTQAAQGLAEEVSLFDIYRKGQIETGKKSMAFHVVYRDQSTTLTDNRVDEIHEKVMRSIEKQFGGVIRAAS
jgi:phenylalanyl-tRNA synthetase beta chain